ncbi:MAG: hypothetical protein Q9182_006981 [Xanthomendoza sp. 2 TL-2023]
MDSVRENVPSAPTDQKPNITGSPPATSLPPEKDRSSTTIDGNTITPGAPYSHFTKIQKRLVVLIITFAATFSPLSSFIFFPAINALSQSLHASVGRINLTITSYMIVSGIAPAILGDIADMTGRRIVYLLTFTIYLAANVGLAVQRSWTALFLLRMLQSAGGAATIAIGYGVISDIAAPSERGGFVGTLLLGPNIATAVGPVLGGALTQQLGWRWIFWILAILSGVCLLLISVFLPETSRYIVGNGCQEVSRLHRTLISYFGSPTPGRLPESVAGTNVSSSDRQDEKLKRNFRIPNPLASLKMLWAKDTALITLIYGIFYMDFSCLQASLSPLFINIYHLSEFNAGLIYLPFGLCGTLLTDLHPKAPASAQAANNIMRCTWAGAGLALLQIIVDAMGTGWTFTLFGGVALACLIVAWLEFEFGMVWRKEMREKGVER